MRRFVAISITMAFSSVLMRADVVFSNVTGTGDVTGSTTPVCAILECGLDFIAGAEFTPSANYSMTDAQVLVSTGGSGVPAFDVFLYSNSGAVPGSKIEQIGFALTATAGSPGSLITANTIGTPITLVSGTPYWLVLAPDKLQSFIWWENGGSPSSPFSGSHDGTNWFSPVDLNDQFQIDGTAAIPEPSSSALLTGIAALIYAITRRQRKNSPTT